MSSVIGNPLLLGDDGYQISRSVRLRSSASAYFERTPSSAGNRQKFTYSFWLKRGTLTSTAQIFLVAGTSTDYLVLYVENGVFSLYGYSGAATTAYSFSAAVFRDPSAWYHVVYKIDTTDATASNRVQIFVNGAQIVVTSSTAIPQNTNLQINNSVVHRIGRDVTNSSQYLDGYLTEVNFIDGQALTPSSFGQNDPITGVWTPKKYTGTYGNNGFYLNFADNSAATAAAIGKDSSGNGNNWTPNNISLTAGATYDSMLDVPTNWADGGNGRGNYATLNPLVNTNSMMTYSGANLECTVSSPNNKFAHSTMQLPLTGKWYFEAAFSSGTSTVSGIGVSDGTVAQSSGAGISGGAVRIYQKTGNKAVSGSASAYGASYTNGDVIGVAVDMDAGTIVFYKNNTSQGTAFTDLAGISWHAAIYNSESTGWINFGQRPFSYTPPTGFKALNTQNLPDPTIKKGNQYFDATLYTGNGTGSTVTNSGGFQPDFVWMKNRGAIADHALYDSLRTAMLSSNTTAAEVAASNIVTYNSNGFSVAGSDSRVNTNGNTYVGWQWKKGATQGFDIVTYTGNVSTSTGGTQTVSHSLGVKPALIIVKSRGGAQNWQVWHKALDTGSFGSNVYLNTTAAAFSSYLAIVTGSSAPTAVNSLSFTVTSYVSPNNANNAADNGVNYVAYLFAEVAGFSKFGSYTGNGSADGPFVFCGFRPRFVLFKRTSGGTGDWYILDTARNTVNVMNARLVPNLADAEATGSNLLDVTANGFKIRDAGTGINGSSSGYIYAAFAENPFKYSLAR